MQGLGKSFKKYMHHYASDKAPEMNAKFNVADILDLSNVVESHYQYHGSLTTPGKNFIVYIEPEAAGYVFLAPRIGCGILSFGKSAKRSTRDANWISSQSVFKNHSQAGHRWISYFLVVKFHRTQ